ncbi:UNVERIFIED_CONTAM: hypothetical protein GTU68_058545 [Idotea baltica]|nr:hypothetical protein [Idotea baltica]
MSYQALARKWRPRLFNEMVGQGHVLQALISALDTNRVHHAYLFTGTRGVGKTTIARIIAKSLNCEQGISATPCGQCSICQEIDGGRFIDLIEVDAASRTKVEDTRELLENIQYAPSQGRFKVYLIDEIHMLSTHSFNALLKTLEEPPEHTKFLFATTDPHKLPATILSRCLQFSLKRISIEKIAQHLAHVLTCEGIPFDEGALTLLGRSAEGSMRDALSLTDQAIAFGRGSVVSQDVRSMLGSLDNNQVCELLQALLVGSIKQVFAVIEHLHEQSPDWDVVLSEMLDVLHQLAIVQLIPSAASDALSENKKLLQIAQKLPPEDIQFYYQVGLIGRRDLPLAPTAKQGFEMILLRMLAFRPESISLSPKISAFDTINSEENNSEPNTLNNSSVSLPIKNVADERSVVVAANLKKQNYLPVNLENEPDNIIESKASNIEVDESICLTNEASKNITNTTPSDSMNYWLDLYPKLNITGLTSSIAANCMLHSIDDDRWLFYLDSSQASLFNQTQKERLNTILNYYFNKKLIVDIDIHEVNHGTPAKLNAEQKMEHQKIAVHSIQNNEQVQHIVERFSASIDSESIKPL